MSTWPKLPETGGGPSTADAKGLAEAARRAIGADRGALKLEQACEAAMVSVIHRPLAVGSHHHRAMLVPTEGGFHAVIDSAIHERAEEGDPGRHRLRFVLAHELGHTFFYGSGRPPKRTRPPDRLEEDFCQRFATFLLVPPAATRRASLDPEGLYALAAEHDVSRQVAAWAIAHARPHLTLLWLAPAPHPVRGGSEAMRVRWGASERFIAQGESFKSSLAELRPGEHGECTETLHLAGRKESMRIKAWRLANSMLAVLEPSTPDAAIAVPGHLRLF